MLFYFFYLLFILQAPFGHIDASSMLCMPGNYGSRDSANLHPSQSLWKLLLLNAMHLARTPPLSLSLSLFPPFSPLSLPLSSFLSSSLPPSHFSSLLSPSPFYPPSLLSLFFFPFSHLAVPSVMMGNYTAWWTWLEEQRGAFHSAKDELEAFLHNDQEYSLQPAH